MQLYTDLIDPATLTGYARASLDDYEQRKGTLARWLPNRYLEDIIARFVKGQTGLINVAKFRAYDAEPEMGKREAGKRVVLELPALGQQIPVSEYDQIRSRSGNVSDAAALRTVQSTTNNIVRAVSDAVERLRGIVLATGKATIDQDNFQSDDNFGRPASHQLVAANPWSSSSVSRLDYLRMLRDLYEDDTGDTPGAFVVSTRVATAIAMGDEFQTQLLNGGARQATEDEVAAIIAGAGLPPLYRYNRRVKVDGVTSRVLPDDGLLVLPAPVDTDAWEATELGATFWGRTLTSQDPDWAIEDGEQPGIVAGVYKNPKPPMGLEVISDAISLPVLANAELSIYAKVL